MKVKVFYFSPAACILKGGPDAPYYPSFSIKTGLVALRLRKGHQLEPITFRSEPYKLWKIKDEHLSSVKEWYINAINAISSEVKMICFGEMTYPFSGNIENDREFQEQMRKLAKVKNLYIVAGSYHDFAAPHGKHYNTSLIFTPECSEPYKQYKLKSAVEADEYCDIVIHKPKLTVVGTPYGNFVVLICVDVENRDIWEKIGHLNSEPKYRGIQFIISPAFDPSFALIKQAEAFSRVHKICVAFVNSFEGSDPPYQSQLPTLYKSGGAPIKGEIMDDIIWIYNVRPEDIKSPIQKIRISP